MNPLLRPPTLPDFAAIRARARRAGASTSCWPRPRRALERAVSAAVPADYDALSAVLDVAARTPRSRLGRRQPPERRGRHAGAARRLQREPAARHRVPHPAGRRRAPVRQVQGGGRAPPAAALTRRAARRWPTRCATSCSSAPNCRARDGSASPQIQDALAELSQRFSEHVLDATDGFALSSTTTPLAGCPPTCARPPARAAAAAGTARLPADAALPVLRAR